MRPRRWNSYRTIEARTKPNADLWTGTDRPHLMSPTGYGPGDYTTQTAKAMRNEPEAVRPEQVAKFSDAADAGIKDRQSKTQAKAT